MTEKTPKTAIVLIPPESVWQPIQGIRRVHDRQFRRWMPHVTLAYPFLPAEQFDAAATRAADACRAFEPFEIQLARFGHFRHDTGSCTIWLAPEPPDPIIRLQSALREAFPGCDDVNRFPSGFTPHLSMGQADEKEVADLLAELQKGWRPVRFAVEAVCLIWRNEPPDDVFRVGRFCAL